MDSGLAVKALSVVVPQIKIVDDTLKLPDESRGSPLGSFPITKFNSPVIHNNYNSEETPVIKTLVSRRLVSKSFDPKSIANGIKANNAHRQSSHTPVAVKAKRLLNESSLKFPFKQAVCMKPDEYLPASGNPNNPKHHMHFKKSSNVHAPTSFEAKSSIDESTTEKIDYTIPAENNVEDISMIYFDNNVNNNSNTSNSNIAGRNQFDNPYTKYEHIKENAMKIVSFAMQQQSRRKENEQTKKDKTIHEMFLTCHQVLNLYAPILSDTQKKELLDYPIVYYMGPGFPLTNKYENDNSMMLQEENSISLEDEPPTVNNACDDSLNDRATAVTDENEVLRNLSMNHESNESSSDMKQRQQHQQEQPMSSRGDNISEMDDDEVDFDAELGGRTSMESKEVSRENTGGYVHNTEWNQPYISTDEFLATFKEDDHSTFSIKSPNPSPDYFMDSPMDSPVHPLNGSSNDQQLSNKAFAISMPQVHVRSLDDVNVGDHIAYRFEVLQLLGKGTFGNVYKCKDHKNNIDIAIKLVKQKGNSIFSRHAKCELDMLLYFTEQYQQQQQQQQKQLKSENQVKRKYCIQLLKYFEFRKFACFVLPVYGSSLAEYIKKKRNNHTKSKSSAVCSIRFMKLVAIQMLECLSFLQSHGIIHGDITPENILLKNEVTAEIVLIDFGNAVFANTLDEQEIKHPRDRNEKSRYYVAPEIVLGCGYGFEVDVWSFACILPELRTGRYLFPCGDEIDLIYAHAEYLGHPPYAMALQSIQRENLFSEFGDLHLPYLTTVGGQEKNREISSKSFYEHVFYDFNQDRGLVKFLIACLRWAPAARLTPEDALKHPWIAKGPFVNQVILTSQGLVDVDTGRGFISYASKGALIKYADVEGKDDHAESILKAAKVIPRF